MRGNPQLGYNNPGFKPGKSGNPLGRPRIPAELRVIRSLLPSELSRLIAKYARMPMEDIRIAAADSKLNGAESLLAEIFVRCKDKSDWSMFPFLIDRSIGKVHQNPESDEEIIRREAIENMTDEEKWQRLAELYPDKVVIEKVG